jgi:pyridoxal 5'-phosphate synthase pdxT subunit
LSRIGILAVQGAFAAHAAMLARLGHAPVEVRSARSLAGLDGLVLPGGESTTQLKLIAALGLRAGITDLCQQKPVLATCAGMILLAQRVRSPEQDSLGLLDVTVQRNGWGRQIDSFEARSEGGRPLVFIRAPRLLEVPPAVEVLDRHAGEAVAVRQRGIVALTFHPELAGDTSFHELAFATRQAATLTAPTYTTGTERSAAITQREIDRLA